MPRVPCAVDPSDGGGNCWTTKPPRLNLPERANLSYLAAVSCQLSSLLLAPRLLRCFRHRCASLFHEEAHFDFVGFIDEPNSMLSEHCENCVESV